MRGKRPGDGAPANKTPRALAALIVADYCAGYSSRAVAARWGVAPSTVSLLCRERGLTRPKTQVSPRFEETE